ncbi:MAG: ABC transporter permease [Ideonella sp.]|nr:ABC transporter permease [Ideonella sp.]
MGLARSLSLFAQLSWPALRYQAGRQGLALLAIVLGVALGFAVHLLNSAALTEFSSAATSLQGQPDVVLRADTAQGLPEAVLATLAADPEVLLASPIIEGQALANDAQGKPISLRLMGWDLLQGAALNPALLPQTPLTGGSSNSPLAGLDPQQLSLNPSAQNKLGALAQTVSLRAAHADSGQAHSQSFTLGPANAAAGPPLAVLDIAAAQVLLGKLGRLNRVDVRLAAGVDPGAWLARQRWPQGVSAAPPADEGQRMSQVTRAYRVNLSMLSLMALFTGSFLVIAVMSLSVAQRLPQWALLGVLGMTGAERARLVLLEALLLGGLGSLLGLALGWGMARWALQALGANLGLGHLSAGLSVAQLPWGAALLFGGLGVSLSMLSSALPALTVRRMPVAQVLKGLGNAQSPPKAAGLGPVLLLLGLGLALLPRPPKTWPLAEVPLAAYAAMLCMLLGGIACVPYGVRASLALLRRWPGAQRKALVLLVEQRARDQAGEASRALAGVLVSLSLSVAMLVMVGSFRDSLTQWLQQMLPADLYVRSSLQVSQGGGTTLSAPLPPAFLVALQNSSVVQAVAHQRSDEVQMGGQRFALTAREVDEQQLPLAEALSAMEARPGHTPIYISEALRDSLQLQVGDTAQMRLRADGPPLSVWVRGVWRDYARQSGAVLMPLKDYQAWTHDARINEVKVWLAPGVSSASAQQALRALAAQGDDIEMADSQELREVSMKIFDRSFAVTVWLQAVTLAIGMFGIAASQSAQVLARRREFGLLLHLGFTRAGVLRLLALESALLCGVGCIAGLGLGLGLSAVLIWVVNPQSFHWSMDMSLPWPRLLMLLGLVFAAGVLSAVLAARQAASTAAVQSVKEDW